MAKSLSRQNSGVEEKETAARAGTRAKMLGQPSDSRGTMASTGDGDDINRSAGEGGLDLAVGVSAVPTAPSIDRLEVMSQEELRFLHADMQSFDDFPAKHAEWIRNPDDDNDFLSLVRHNREFLEANRDWLWPPNATTEDALLCAANNSTQATKYRNNASFGIKVNPGEVLFARRKNKQSLYGQGMHFFGKSLWKRRDGCVEDLYASQIIQRGLIVIVNLQPNQIAIALHCNEPVILLPGRHAYHDPDFKLCAEDIFTMEEMGPTIKKHTVVIVRVGEWECGLGYQNGNPILLKPGLHVSRDPSFQFSSTMDTRKFGRKAEKKEKKEKGGHSAKNKTQDDLFGHDDDGVLSYGNKAHDNVSIVKIPQSLYGCAFVSGEPVFMHPGLHMYNNPSFSFSHCVRQAQAHIEFDNLHIIQIQPDQIGLAWQGSDPYLMQPGIWSKSSPLFRFTGFRHAQERTIEHGSITRYVIENGELGFAWKDGHVCEITPGIGITNDPNFKFIRTHKQCEEVYQFGNIAHVTTREGHKRPVYVNGKLFILGAGYKKFFDPNLVVGDAFPTGEIIRPIETLEVLTRDRTPMLVTGQVTYQIRNANDLILNLGYHKLEQYIEHTLSAILRHAFSITDLSTISPDSKDIDGGNGNEGHPVEDEVKDPMPLFKRDAENAEGQNFRSELITEIHKELARNTQSWGIVVHEVAISDIQFKDQAVADKLAAATSNTRTAEAEFDLTLAQSKIRLEKAQVDAKEKLI